jgi:hypothetical protein
MDLGGRNLYAHVYNNKEKHMPECSLGWSPFAALLALASPDSIQAQTPAGTA